MSPVTWGHCRDGRGQIHVLSRTRRISLGRNLGRRRFTGLTARLLCHLFGPSRVFLGRVSKAAFMDQRARKRDKGAGVGVGLRVGAGAMPQAWGGFGHSLAIWPSWRQLRHLPRIGQSLATWAPRQMSHSTSWPTYQHFTLRLPMLRFRGMAFSLTIWTIRVPVETAGAPG